MNEQWEDIHERGISERFDRGERDGRNPDEKKILESYVLLRNAVSKHRTPGFDTRELMQAMKREAEQKRWDLSWIYNLYIRIPEPVFAGLSIVLFIVLVYGFLHTIRTPAHNAVREIQSVDSGSLPIFWEYRLQQGKFVNVPGKSTIRLTLADGSVLSCSPETQLAVRFNQFREIILQNGSIRVKAQSNKEKPMIVKTPLLDVQVVGTEFQVELIQ